MVTLDTITLRVDTSPIVEAIKEVQCKFVVALRSLPVVQVEDGSQWVDVTDLLRLADKLEAELPKAVSTDATCGGVR